MKVAVLDREVANGKQGRGTAKIENLELEAIVEQPGGRYRKCLVDVVILLLVVVAHPVGKGARIAQKSSLVGNREVE